MQLIEKAPRSGAVGGDDRKGDLKIGSRRPYRGAHCVYGFKLFPLSVPILPWILEPFCFTQYRHSGGYL